MLNVTLKVKHFFDYYIWHVSPGTMPRVKGYFIHLLRIFVLSVRGYIEDRIGIRASALTFFSLLSVVPVLATIFGIAQGFGVRKVLHNHLQRSLEGHEEVFNWVVTFADSMLENTKGGWIAGIGIFILLWSVIKVLWNIENSFNHIWQVRKQRNFVRRLSDYISLIIIAPILMVMSSSINIYITTLIQQLSSSGGLIGSVSPIIVLLLKFSPFLLIWMLLTLLYTVMPNTTVNFKSALMAAIVAGSMFQLVQWGYIHFQIGVSRYNAVYGSFAAFPLFLIFLQIAWLIVLFGAELSYAHQNVTDYEYEKDIKDLSSYNKQLACLAVLHSVIKAFEKGERPRSIDCLINQFGAPLKLVKQVLHILVKSDLIVETETNDQSAYLPVSDIHKLDLNTALNKLSDSGGGNIRFDVNEPISGFNRKLQQFRKENKASRFNVLIKDI